MATIRRDPHEELFFRLPFPDDVLKKVHTEIERELTDEFWKAELCDHKSNDCNEDGPSRNSGAEGQTPAQHAEGKVAESEDDAARGGIVDVQQEQSQGRS